MSDTKELEVKVQRLQEALDQTQADRLIESVLSGYDMLPMRVKDRLRSTLIVSYPLTESGTIDVAKFTESINTAVKAEIEYLQSMGAFGHIKNLGDTSNNQPEQDRAKIEERLAASLGRLGMSESEAKHAVKGRM